MSSSIYEDYDMEHYLEDYGDPLIGRQVLINIDDCTFEVDNEPEGVVDQDTIYELSWKLKDDPEVLEGTFKGSMRLNDPYDNEIRLYYVIRTVSKGVARDYLVKSTSVLQRCMVKYRENSSVLIAYEGWKLSKTNRQYRFFRVFWKRLT